MLAERLSARIRREGPIPFDAYVEAALYDDEFGFFATGHGAGRAGHDFVTSPEVGSLYGALVARALDNWWHDLREPDPFVVVEAGAGNARLARDVLRALPECAPALRYVLVERSPGLRAEHAARLEPAVDLERAEDVLGPALPTGDPDDPLVVEPRRGPMVCSLADLPAVGVRDGVLFANELLDNLPFRIVERGADGWQEVRVGLEADAFTEVLVPAAPELTADVADLADGGVGERVPVCTGIREFLGAAGTCIRRGVVAFVDYGAPLRELAPRPWLRTYARHGRGVDPLAAPGAHDITIDVPTDVVVRMARGLGWKPIDDVAQADWLRQLGIEELVATARADWEAGRARADLTALAARSTVHEADALLDPGGLGAHRVLTFARP